MGSSGSNVGSWVRASQSLPPYGIRGPPWQDVAAHAVPTVSDHQWPCTTSVVQSSSAVPDSIARNLVPNNPGEPPQRYKRKWYRDYSLPSPTFSPQKSYCSAWGSSV